MSASTAAEKALHTRLKVEFSAASQRTRAENFLDALDPNPSGPADREDILPHAKTLLLFCESPEDTEPASLRGAFEATKASALWSYFTPRPEHVAVAAEAMITPPRPDWLLHFIGRESSDADGERVFVVDAVCRADSVDGIIGSGEFSDFSRQLAARLRPLFDGPDVFVGIQSDAELDEPDEEIASGE